MGVGLVALTCSTARSEQPEANLQAQLAAGDLRRPLRPLNRRPIPSSAMPRWPQVAAAQFQAGGPGRRG